MSPANKPHRLSSGNHHHACPLRDPDSLCHHHDRKNYPAGLQTPSRHQLNRFADVRHHRCRPRHGEVPCQRRQAREAISGPLGQSACIPAPHGFHFDGRFANNLTAKYGNPRPDRTDARLWNIGHEADEILCSDGARRETHRSLSRTNKQSDSAAGLRSE